MEISVIHLILIMLSSLHSLIQVPLNMILQLPLSRAIFFWPKFYYSLFKYKEGRRSFWSIVTKPLGADYRRPVRHPNQTPWLNVRYYCHSFYQTKGAYDNIHQPSDKDIKDAFDAATAKVFYDDPLDLALPYTFLWEFLPDKPDGALKSMFSLILILLVYIYPVLRVLIIHWYSSIFYSILDKDNRNVFMRQGIRHREKFIPMPTLYARAFATADDHIKDSLMWDTDGILFVIENSATDIISSQHILFTGPLIPTSVTLETA